MANVSEGNNQDFSNLINPYTNKPVHTGKSVSFNQRTYDDVNYMQAKNDLLNNFNATMTKPQSVNQQALYDIPVVPEFLQEEYTKAYSENSWLDSLNIATPEEIDEWRAMGKMGIGETAQRLKSLKSAKYAPFVGTTAEVGYNLDMLSAVNRLKKGKQISDTERDLLVDYLRELKEIQVRGTTLPSKALSAMLESIPYMIEFGIGVASAPATFGGGLAASGAALTKAAGKKAARKAVAKALQNAAVESTMTGTKKTVSLSAAKSLYKSTYDSMLKAGATKAVKEVGAKEAAKIVAKNTPKDIARAAFGSPALRYMTAKNIAGGTIDRQLSGSMQVTDAGEAVFLEPENMALSIMKAFGTAVFDNYTETMGWAFAPISSYFAKPVRKVLPQKFFTEFDKLVSSRYGIPATQALKKFGYDGVLEEMGEELLNRFLCQTFGINGLDEYTFDGFMNNVFYANEPEQWLVEALSFAMLGGAAHATYGAANKIGEVKQQKENEKIAKENQEFIKKIADLANKRIFSPEEYYLEQGLIKINGSQSEAERILREKFLERGVDKVTADDFINNSSELEIRNQLKKFIEEDNKDAGKRREKAVNFLADKMLQNKSYSNKNLANKNANLFVTALEKFSETTGISIEELIKNETPMIRNQSVDSENKTSADEISNAENLSPEEKQKRIIDARLQELEQEFSNINEENYDADKFEALEKEYNDLVELKNQGEKYYQEANIAGAESGELLKAAKEWNEKGTESQYFKKWFGDSKVVDENGSPLVVYHGTVIDNIQEFEANNSSTDYDFPAAIYFSDSINIAKTYGDVYHKTPMPVYLSIKNPLVLDANGQTYNDYYDDLKREMKYAVNNNYDGVIVKNIRDDWAQNDGGEVATDYIVFNPEQIKSVNNQGTFDADNPNIYYQSAETAGAESGELLKAAKEWNEKGTESQYFKKWFGESKVVDANGSPLVVYHGTDANFNTFEKGDIGFHFGTRKAAEERKSETGNLMPVYLSIQNPLYLENDPYQFDETGELHNILKDLDLLPDDVLLDSEKVDVEQILEYKNMGYGDNPYLDMTNYRKALEKKGYDGIIYKNEYEDKGSYSYIAFHPEQIKSVNNQGTFDADNPNIYYQSAYHGTPHKFDKFSLEHIGTGEGAQAHGWGLYFAGNKDVSDDYRIKLSGYNSSYDVYENGEKISGSLNEYINNNLSGSVLYTAARDNEQDDFRENVKWHIDYLKRGDAATVRLIDTLQTQIDKIEANPKLSISKFLSEIPEGEKYRFQSLINAAKKTAKEEGRKVNINDVLSWIKKQQEPFVRERKNQLEILAGLENLDTSKLEVKRNMGQLFEVDIPDDEVLLDEQKTFDEQSDFVKEVLNNSGIRFDKNDTGKIIYEKIGNEFSAKGTRKQSKDKSASEYLNMYGIKGIKYDGHRDGECYVIFDDKAVNVLNRYYQTDYTQFSVDELESIGRYRNFVDKVLNNKLSKKEQSNLFVIGKTPARLVEAGIPQNDLAINISIVKKAQDKRNKDHNLSPETISDVYEALHNPIAIIKAEAENRYSAILDLQNEQGDYVLVALEADKKRRTVYLNDITSIHSRSNYEPIIDKALNDGRLLKVDIDKIRNLLLGGSGIIPEGGQASFDKDLPKPKIQPDIISGGAASLLERIYQQQNNVKYYQSDKNEFSENKNIVDWTDKFDKVPTFEEIEKNIKEIIASGEVFDTLSPEWKIDIKGGNRVVNKITNQGNFQNLQNSAKKRHNKYVSGIKELINNAEYDHSDKNTKQKEKPNVLNYHYFNVNVKIGEKVYSVSLECEETKQAPQGNYAKRSSKSHWSNNNVNQTNNNVNVVHLYNIKENKINKYYQEGDDSQGNLFFDNLKARDLHKIKGSYLPAENLIELFKNADESTIIHEFAHWWLDRLVKYSQNNEELSEDVEAIKKWVKNDGGEFTREQHEKFARGFETYIRSGYAKNNRLKKIFEDFKNALLAIYDSIKQLGFRDDELPEIQNLFDRLMTTERERIKATVFDKIAEIDEKIENIKEHEADEFKELDTIYKDNIEINNRKSDKKRKIEEYIHLAETIPFRETKETREFKQRYRDVTLNILSAYSGKSKAWVANPRNWSKLQELIGDANDNISASNGFLPEWREFYTDTGVSYENSEIDGDYKLAQKAFDILSLGDFSDTYDEHYKFAEIDKFITKIDYLIAKMKTVKGEEKAVVYDAIFALFDKMPEMPDDACKSILDKISKATEDYEEQQKDDFNKKRYPTIPVMQQLQFYITQKLNNLKVYNPETRYKMRLNKSHRLYKFIQKVNSVNSAKKQIRKINEFIIDDMRNNQRSLLHKEIQKQIRVNSKLVKVGTMTKGKFDWKTNTCFAELVKMNKMTQKDAEKELGNYIQIDDAAKSEARDSFDENETGEFNKTNDFQDNLKKEFLQYRSQKIQNLDVTHTIQLLQDILELKEEGRKAKSEEDFIERTKKWSTKNNLLDILEITKQSGAQFGANWIAGVGGFANVVSLNGGTLANWESLLNAIFNKDISRKYSLLKDEADTEVYARKHMMDFYKKAAEIYNFKSPNGFDTFLDFDNMQPLIKLFQEYDNEKYDYIQQVFSINSPDGIAKSTIELSRSQLITMFAWSLNDQLEQRLMTQFGVEQIRDMFENKLSKEDKDLAWALVDTCEGMREDINEVFIRTTGLSLPKVENYFPSKAERVQSDIDMYHDFFVKSTNPSFIKQRKTCNRIPMKPMSPLEILIPHINKTAKYVVMSEKVNWLNQIFKDTAIKTKMQEIWGSDNGARIYQTMINKLAACTFTNYSKGTNLIAGALDTVSRNYITSAIGFSGKVALGQLLSVINYAENMPSGVWAKGFTETLKHPVENFKYMLEHCDYLKTRLAGNSQNEVIAILTSEKDKFRTLRNFMTSNVKWGDIIAITLGGKPYVDYLMSQGMSEKEAFDKFVEDTLRAQQAGTTSSISEWQTAQAKNCFTRMFFAFRNTDIQYERKFVDTLIQAKRGEISKSEAFKKIMIYKVLNPFMFMSCLQNLSLFALIRAIFAGDDPEDYATNFAKSAIEALMLSGLNAYGMAGFLASIFMETLISVFDKEFKHFETSTPVLTDFERQTQKIASGDLEFADYVDALSFGSEIAIGIPSSKVVNFAGGIGDIAQGNVGVGATRMAGWGRYTSTKAWTGEEPERKRRKRKK